MTRIVTTHYKHLPGKRAKAAVIARGFLLPAVFAVAGLPVTVAGRVGTHTATQPNSAVVTFWSGKEMLDYCRDDNQAVREGCTGFAMGVADTAAEALAAGGIAKPFVCRPEEVSGSQARDVILQYLQAHPGELHYSAASLGIRALAAAWPCP